MVALKHFDDEESDTEVSDTEVSDTEVVEEEEEEEEVDENTGGEEKNNNNGDEDDDEEDDDEEEDDDDEEGNDEEDDDDGEDVKEKDDAGKTATKVDSEESDKGETKRENSLSRRSRKKLEKYAADKSKRRAAERERRKRRAAEMRDTNENDPGTEGENFQHKKKRLKKNKMTSSDCKLRVVVDCSFDDKMERRDLSKLCKEIQSAYVVNRRLTNPLQLILTSLDENSQVKQMFDQVYQGSSNWDIGRESDHHSKVYSSEEIVYLTSESENALQQLDNDKVYVIGGLSDQDRHKGHCHGVATSLGLAHARLPIEEHVESPSCRVLTVSRVFGAFAEMSNNGGDWKKALEAVMPKMRTREAEGEKTPQKRTETAGQSKKKKRTKRGGKKHKKENKTEA